MESHAIKVRMPEGKRWEFLTPAGGLTHLRIHAGTAAQDAAERTVARLREDNPGVEFKVVEFK